MIVLDLLTIGPVLVAPPLNLHALCPFPELYSLLGIVLVPWTTKDENSPFSLEDSALEYNVFLRDEVLVVCTFNLVPFPTDSPLRSVEGIIPKDSVSMIKGIKAKGGVQSFRGIVSSEHSLPICARI